MIQNLCRSKEAPFLSTLAVIGGKWKMRILYELSCDSILRYGGLTRLHEATFSWNIIPVILSPMVGRFLPIHHLSCDRWRI